jgi:Flp pilus assembly protein TadG
MTPSASADRSQSGSAAIEFALVAPPLMTLIVGVLMLGLAYFEGATVQWALERSLRAAMLHPELTPDDIEAMVMAELADHGSPEIAFAYEIDDTGEVPLAVATASYDVPLEVPFLPDMALHFAAENVAPVPES